MQKQVIYFASSMTLDHETMTWKKRKNGR